MLVCRLFTHYYKVTPVTWKYACIMIRITVTHNDVSVSTSANCYMIYMHMYSTSTHWESYCTLVQTYIVSVNVVVLAQFPELVSVSSTINVLLFKTVV